MDPYQPQVLLYKRGISLYMLKNKLRVNYIVLLKVYLYDTIYSKVQTY